MGICTRGMDCMVPRRPLGKAISPQTLPENNFLDFLDFGTSSGGPLAIHGACLLPLCGPMGLFALFGVPAAVIWRTPKCCTSLLSVPSKLLCIVRATPCRPVGGEDRSVWQTSVEPLELCRPLHLVVKGPNEAQGAKGPLGPKGPNGPKRPTGQKKMWTQVWV